MRTRSPHGGRHELGQNFLVHSPTLARIVELVAATDGDILEIGAGDGALTVGLASLGRRTRALELDERRVAALARRLPRVEVEAGDVLRHPLDAPVVVGNVPFHLTTPIMRRLLDRGSWRCAILLTQWEVARKRAGVGGRTMMSVQAAPWFTFELHARVPAHGFRPMPSVDGGLIGITRRTDPLLPVADRRAYERFVKEVFTGRGRGIAAIVASAGRIPRAEVAAVMRRLGVDARSLPRDLTPEEWAGLWIQVRERRR